MRLLSIGEWLQQGCKLVGTKLKMAIQQGMSMSLVLYPKRPGDTIYWLTATLDNKQQSLVSMSTLFQVDYDLMHRQMGHPSKDVLSQAKHHTTNFPKDLIKIVQFVEAVQKLKCICQRLETLPRMPPNPLN